VFHLILESATLRYQGKFFTGEQFDLLRACVIGTGGSSERLESDYEVFVCLNILEQCTKMCKNCSQCG
jgi:hypothetical protein